MSNLIRSISNGVDCIFFIYFECMIIQIYRDVERAAMNVSRLIFMSDYEINLSSNNKINKYEMSSCT